MCVGYTDLNKVHSKDNYQLPRIDQLVDSIVGHEVLSFLDVYNGYNQIFIHRAVVEKTTFITEQGTYCYKVMPFRLKNAIAIFQRLVTWVFENLIRNQVEVYVDNLVEKNEGASQHPQNLFEVFFVLRHFNIN